MLASTDFGSLEEHPTSLDDERLVEIEYHRKMNRWLMYLLCPIYLFFTVFHYFRGDLLQALIFGTLLIDAVTATIVGQRIKDLDHLVLLKRICGGLAIGLLTASLFVGLLGEQFFYFWAWAFTFPVAILLFFGKRFGAAVASLYTVLAAAVLLVVDFPSIDQDAMLVLRVTSAMALFCMLGVGLTSEKARLRIQKDLVAARKASQEAAEDQRQANLKLQREIELRKQSQAKLAQSEVRYRALFEESAASLWDEDWSRVKTFIDTLPEAAKQDLGTYLDSNPADCYRCMSLFRVHAVNQGTLRIYRADSWETLRKNIAQILPPDRERLTAERISALYHSGEFNTELDVRTIDGRPLRILARSTVPAGYESSWAHVFTTIYDVTERAAMAEQKRRVERQMAQAQQFQAVATLAGGIAHQFNNALAVIYGNLDMIGISLEGQPKIVSFVDALKQSAERMDQLTSQLLAYAQGGKYLPKPFSANDLLEDIVSAEEFDPPHATLVLRHFDPALGQAIGDTTQIKMVFQAVLANALESIETDGVIRISTRNQQITAASENTDPVLEAGAYAVICIEDNGSGMDEESRRRIFEPFFSTKFFGRGLGMAAAYGIVRSHDGLIRVDSVADEGTRVTIYLPCPKDSVDIG